LVVWEHVASRTGGLASGPYLYVAIQFIGWRTLLCVCPMACSVGRQPLASHFIDCAVSDKMWKCITGSDFFAVRFEYYNFLSWWMWYFLRGTVLGNMI
jgi:hypothetical protein